MTCAYLLKKIKSSAAGLGGFLKTALQFIAILPLEFVLLVLLLAVLGVAHG